jgi:hypothetical protein
MKLNPILASAITLASTAQADTLLLIDITVPNQVTFLATPGLAEATASASNFQGFLLADFFAFPGEGLAGNVMGFGDLSTTANPADFSPSIFQGASSHGLNIWSFSTDTTVDVTAGSQAFAGSATFDLTPTQYAGFLNAQLGGDIYFAADTDDDILQATYIGRYGLFPTPSSLALLGFAALTTTRRKR